MIAVITLIAGLIIGFLLALFVGNKPAEDTEIPDITNLEYCSTLPKGVVIGTAFRTSTKYVCFNEARLEEGIKVLNKIKSIIDYYNSCEHSFPRIYFAYCKDGSNGNIVIHFAVYNK